MRNAGRIKLGYFLLPLEEAQNIRALLLAGAFYAVIDSCVGDGTALLRSPSRPAHIWLASNSALTGQVLRPPRMARSSKPSFTAGEHKPLVVEFAFHV